MSRRNSADHLGQIALLDDNQAIDPVRSKAFVKIIEQPSSRNYRFRYKCEGNSAGSLLGVRSTPKKKIYPAIQVFGYNGPAIVVVSCVTVGRPYRAHPNNLAGKGVKSGVYTTNIIKQDMTIDFQHLGIQYVKRKDIEDSMYVREQIRVDPFKQGFAHKNRPTLIDLGAVRLCFQVILEGSTPGKYTVPLEPVVSNPIYDKKAKADLSIIKLSQCVDYVDGGRKDIILLCERVTKNDIKIRFFEERNSEVTWEQEVKFDNFQVFKQCSIWFRSPPYKSTDIVEPVRVFMQLVRPSDGVVGEPRPFEFLPIDFRSELKKMRRENDDILKQMHSNPQSRAISNYLQSGNDAAHVLKENPADTNWNITYEEPQAQMSTNGLEIDSEVLNVLETKIVNGNGDILPDIGNLSMP